MNPLHLPNVVYDVLKYIAQVVLPGLAVFVAAVGPVWDWPSVNAWVKTIVALDAFLGSLLLVSQVTYARQQPAEDV